MNRYLVKTIYALIFLALFNSCAVYHAQTGTKLRKGGDFSSVPFRQTPATLIAVPVTAGNYEMDFIFDTGANYNVLSESELGNFKTRKIGKMKVRDVNGQVNKLQLVNIHNFKVGDYEFKKAKTLVVPNLYSLFDCQGSKGLIGYNVIKKLNWNFNQSNNTLQISKQTFSPDTTTFFKHSFLNVMNLQPRVMVNINGKNHWSLFDTGASSTIRIKGDTSQIPLTEKASDWLTKNTIGVFGKVENAYPTREYLSDSVLVNNQNYGSMPVYYGAKDNIIGLGAIGDRSFVLNMTQAQIWIENRQADRDLSLESNGYSLGFKADGQIEVSGIRINGAAWNAGIRLGDLVEQINGVAATEIFKDECSLFFRQNKELVEILTKREVSLKIKDSAEAIRINPKE